MTIMTRRDFLKKSALAATALGASSGLEPLSNGCATVGTETKEAASVIYPPLKGNKVQPPENGCLVGFRRVYADHDKKGFDKLIEAVKRSKNLEEYERLMEPNNWRELIKLEDAVNQYSEYYKKELNNNPKILVLYDTPKLFRPFPSTEASVVCRNGMIPYVNMLPCYYFKPSVGFPLEDINAGKRDSYLKNLAEGARQYGEKHGGFFITTMEESNGYWDYWGQNRNFIPAWRHIWQIFEDQGANEYATWVWECYCPETKIRAKHPEFYYPGDEYVDWIGFSAYANQAYRSTMVPFNTLVNKTFNQMRKKHPQKPIMQAEFGRTNTDDQYKWLIDAYKTIKAKPGIKAAIYYDNVFPPTSWDPYGNDRTLNKRSLETLKEILKDPYWIMAK